MRSEAQQPNPSGRRLERRFVAEPHAVRAARHALGELELELGPRRSRKAELLVSELVANAVVHGSRRPTDPIALSVWSDDGTVRVEVADRGPGFQPGATGRAGELRPDGWGLFLVERLADRWGVARASAPRVWFELDADRD